MRYPNFIKFVAVLILFFEEVKAQKQTVDFELLDKSCKSSPGNAYSEIGEERTTCYYDRKNYFSADEPDSCCNVKTSPNDVARYGFCRGIPYGQFLGYPETAGQCEKCPKEGEHCKNVTGCCQVTSNSEKVLKCDLSLEVDLCKKIINPEPLPVKCLSKKFCSDMICSNPEFLQAECGKNGNCLCPINLKSTKLCSKTKEASHCAKSVPKNYLIDSVFECKDPATKTKRARSYCTYIGLNEDKIATDILIHNHNFDCNEVCGNSNEHNGLRGIGGFEHCFCVRGFNNKNGCVKASSDSKCARIDTKEEANSRILVCPIPRSTNNICVEVQGKPKCRASGEACVNDYQCCSNCCADRTKCASGIVCFDNKLIIATTG